MNSEIEISETPNWLKELEAKRERRLKTKLGHELGAGAPCLTCEEKCPGLDLHFWRKICKNCKCSKENHEVQDDDIYGWAQDELLGTKVNRLKRKIVLPGRKDEVELEWAPNGQKETIDKYLKTVPPELLPIKGSQAAQDRKQLLKKQIPIHDIDPTLCHELTDEELKKMQEYVAHIKQSSVGVGHLIQINIDKGTTHIFDKNDAMFLINNVPKGIVSSENVILQGGINSVPLKNLANKFGTLEVKEKDQLGVNQPHPGIATEIEDQNPTYMNLRDKHYNVNDLGSGNNTNEVKENYNPNNKRFLTEDVQEPRGSNLRDINYDSNLYENIPVPPKNVLAHDQMQTFSGGLRDVLYPTNPYGNSNIKNLVPSAFVPIKHSDMNYNDDSYSHGLDQGNVRELPYPSHFINNQFKHGKNLPNYNPGSYAIFNEHQNPAYFEPIKDLRYSQNQNISESPELEAQVPLSNSYKARDGGMNKNLGYTQYPSEMSKMNDLSVGSGEIKEGAGNLYGSQEPMTNISYNQEVPVRNIARSEAAKAQLPFSSNPHLINTVPYSRNDVLEENSGLVKQSNSPLPHLMGGKTNLYEDAQIPAKIKNIKDLAYSTYDAPPEEQEDFHNLSVKDRLNLIKKGELPSFRPKNSSVSDYNLSPNKFNMKDDIAGYNRSSSPSSRQGYDNSSPMRHKENISQQLAHRGVTEDLSIQDPNLTKNFPSPNKVNTKNNDPMKEIVHSNRPLNSPSGRKHENLPSYASGTKSIHEDNLQPSFIPIGGIRDIQYEDPEIRTALSKDNDLFEGSTPNKFIPNTNLAILPCCHYCKQKFKQDELAIAIPERSDAIYHTECFKCHGCNQILADMFYFYDKESDNIYCGRDYAKIRGIPRCKACDELIFVKEYCLAENSTFHVKHFCCFECDKPLAGQNYVMENDQPVCVPCYELTKANKCYACKEVIHPDQQGLQLKDGVHFHATDDCFACKVCKKALFGAKLLFRKDCLYCSHDCYNSDV